MEGPNCTELRRTGSTPVSRRATIRTLAVTGDGWQSGLVAEARAQNDVSANRLIFNS